MTDIVERLCDGEHCTVGCAKLRAEAAAEIERLRGEIESWKALVAKYEGYTDARRALEPKP
jgi:hypothetical protein